MRTHAVKITDATPTHIHTLTHTTTHTHTHDYTQEEHALAVLEAEGWRGGARKKVQLTYELQRSREALEKRRAAIREVGGWARWGRWGQRQRHTAEGWAGGGWLGICVVVGTGEGLVVVSERVRVCVCMCDYGFHGCLLVCVSGPVFGGVIATP